MSKHTKGPWKAMPVDAVETVVPMQEVYGSNNSVVARRIANPDDARLIAAAPELLNVMKQLADYVVDLGEESAWNNIREKTRQQRIIILSMVDDAIAKAEGDSNE